MRSRSYTVSTIVTAVLMFVSPGFVSPGGAASFNTITSSGQPVRIGSHSFWDAACQGQPAPVQIVEQPQHGRLSARVETIKITRIEYGSGRCLGQRVPGRVVYYSPQPGFVGTDQFYYVSLKRGGDPVPHRGSVVVR